MYHNCIPCIASARCTDLFLRVPELNLKISKTKFDIYFCGKIGQTPHKATDNVIRVYHQYHIGEVNIKLYCFIEKDTVLDIHFFPNRILISNP